MSMADEMGIGPLDVHVLSMPETPVERTLGRQTFRTIVLNANNLYQELLSGPDPQRMDVIIIANDGPVVLSDSMSGAQATDNITTGLGNPRGALIPQNVMVRIPCAQTEIWASCFLTGINVNRITVITVHKARM